MAQRARGEGLAAAVALTLPLAALLISQGMLNTFEEQNVTQVSLQEIQLLEPEVAPVSLSTAAELVIATKQPPSLRYSGEEGLVSELAAEPTQMLHHGDHVMSVDGVPVHLFISQMPLIEDVSPKSKAHLINAVIEFLAKNGHSEVQIKDRWSPSLTEAIRAFSAETGRQHPGERFPTEWVLWNSGPIMVAQYEVELNQRIHPDEIVGTVKPAITHVELAQTKDFNLEEPYEVVHEGQRLDISSSADQLRIESEETATYVIAQLSEEISSLPVELIAQQEVELLQVPSSAAILREPGIACVFTPSNLGASNTNHSEQPAQDHGSITLTAHPFEIKHEQHGSIFADPQAGLPEQIVADVAGFDTSECGRKS